MFRDAIDRGSFRPVILSLATVDSEGHPHVRMVVCRRIGDDGSLWIASDARSGKHVQLAARPEAAAVCWIGSTREQFQFEGKVQVFGDSSGSPDRIGLWREISPESRALFFWPAPGRPRERDEACFVASSDAVTPPDSFEILVLRPSQVEYLGLSVHPPHRLRWTLLQGWRPELLNP
jgi:PPOX class probable FMN-dependent enzyme